MKNMGIIPMLFPLVILLFFTSCGSISEIESDEITSLDESTQILFELLKKDCLQKVLMDTNKEQIALMTKNYSLAQIALEAEVLTFEGLSILVFFYNEDEVWQQLRKSLLSFAKEHPEVKIVEVNSRKLFTIAEFSMVEDYPAIIAILERDEVFRLEGDEIDSNISEKLEFLIKHKM